MTFVRASGAHQISKCDDHQIKKQKYTFTGVIPTRLNKKAAPKEKVVAATNKKAAPEKKVAVAKNKKAARRKQQKTAIEANNVKEIWDIVRVIPKAQEQIPFQDCFKDAVVSVLGIQSKSRRQLGSL